MSTDIQTGKILPVIGNQSTSKSLQKGHSTEASKAADSGRAAGADTVSMTDQVERLKKFETMLADIPPVNPQLVNEMKLALANGSLDMDFDGTAAKLIEIEGANSGSSNS